MLSREHQVQDSKWFFVQDLFHQIITPFPVIQFWSSYSVSFKHSHIAMPSTNLRTKTLPFSPGSDNKRSANSPHQQTASTVGRNEMFELTLELKLYKISSNYTSLLEIPSSLYILWCESTLQYGKSSLDMDSKNFFKAWINRLSTQLCQIFFVYIQLLQTKSVFETLQLM